MSSEYEKDISLMHTYVNLFSESISPSDGRRHLDKIISIGERVLTNKEARFVPMSVRMYFEDQEENVRDGKKSK